MPTAGNQALYAFEFDQPRGSPVVKAQVKASVAALLHVSLYPKDEQRNCSKKLKVE